ncbi:MAG: class I SAM-dependent methyltransferase [Pseudomonadota bacterium]|nr:class I SAM-dependent methyltransferase [Pseudomonadota bacterium]
MRLNDQYSALLAQAVEKRDGFRSQEAYLSHVLQLTSRWRSKLIANTLLEREGATVLNGPFAGMAYGRFATAGALAPRLLGSYESELHPTILGLVGSGLEAVIDIGCAEGFYAVGLARLLPEVQVHAYDVDPRAREACAELARQNGVSDRVHVGGLFAGADFARFADRRTLVFIDAEGAENELLDPEAFPALRAMTVIVETHEHERPGVIDRLHARFAASHAIERLDQEPKTTPLPAWISELGHLDQLLVSWEWRVFPTPWLVMRPR